MFRPGLENDTGPSFSYTGYRNAAPAGKRCCKGEKKEVFLCLKQAGIKKMR